MHPLFASIHYPQPYPKKELFPTIQLPVDYIFEKGEPFQHRILDGADATGCQVGHFCPGMDVMEGVAALGRDGSALGQEENEASHRDQV